MLVTFFISAPRTWKTVLNGIPVKAFLVIIQSSKQVIEPSPLLLNIFIKYLSQVI